MKTVFRNKNNGVRIIKVSGQHYFYLIFPRHGLDPRDFAPLLVFAPCGPDMDRGVVFQLVGVVKYTPSIVRAHHGKLSVLKKNE